jgi:hypothetical protein
MNGRIDDGEIFYCRSIFIDTTMTALQVRLLSSAGCSRKDRRIPDRFPVVPQQIIIVIIYGRNAPRHNRQIRFVFHVIRPINSLISPINFEAKSETMKPPETLLTVKYFIDH